MGKEQTELELAGRTVTVTSPSKVYFPDAGYTKLDVVRYYIAVGEGAVRGVRDRPMAMKRFVKGIGHPAFFQKRAPDKRPGWIRTATLRFPSGRSAEEVVVDDLSQLIWVVNLGCIDLNPHAIRSGDLDHPDELRIDLDPIPGVPWTQTREVAHVVHDVLTEHQLVGFPKTSGSRGIHINARIQPRWSFAEVRRAALAVAREVERRMPGRASASWFKEERQGVFVDYNQNAKDRTTASAYSVRPTPDARVSAPFLWDEIDNCELGDFTLSTMPARFEARGDVGAAIDDPANTGTLDSLLELFKKQAASGAADPGQPDKVSGKRSRKEAAEDVIVIAQAKAKEDALAGLDRWKTRHPQLADKLRPEEILVDAMRGRSSTWTRIRINLARFEASERPPSEPPDPDYDVRSEWRK